MSKTIEKTVVSTAETSAPSAPAEAQTSPIATLIQKGKSAEGRLRKISGDSFSILDWKVNVSGKGDKRKVGGASCKGRRFDETAVSSLSVGDAEALPAYQGLLVALQYMELTPNDIAVTVRSA